jgi:hypothetical protein
MFRGGPARFSAGEGPTKDRYGSQSKANSRSIRGRLCFPKVPVPSDHETPNSFSVVRRMVVISSVPSMSRPNRLARDGRRRTQGTHAG